MHSVNQKQIVDCPANLSCASRTRGGGGIPRNRLTYDSVKVFFKHFVYPWPSLQFGHEY